MGDSGTYGFPLPCRLYRATAHSALCRVRSQRLYHPWVYLLLSLVVTWTLRLRSGRTHLRPLRMVPGSFGRPMTSAPLCRMSVVWSSTLCGATSRSRHCTVLVTLGVSWAVMVQAVLGATLCGEKLALLAAKTRPIRWLLVSWTSRVPSVPVLLGRTTALLIPHLVVASTLMTSGLSPLLCLLWVFPLDRATMVVCSGGLLLGGNRTTLLFIRSALLRSIWVNMFLRGTTYLLARRPTM